MDVASLCPLPVGVVRWRSPGRSLTVVVKMSLALSGDEVALADPQEPLSLDRPLPGGAADELYQASDFVPRKALCDVLLVGSARVLSPSPAPATAIHARLSFGELDRRFVALAGAPSSSIPLSSAYLREGSDATSPPVIVGPRGPRSPERAGFPGALSAVGANGAPFSPLDADFDFGFFNAAPLVQQVSALRSGGVLTLEGLLPGRAIAKLDLPSDRPRIYYLRAASTGARRDQAPLLCEIPLRCDTLWIDTDRELCSLTWRGELAISDGEDEPSLLVVTLAPFGLGESLRSIEARLDRAPRACAMEVSDEEGSSNEAVQTALPFRVPPEL